MLAYPFQKQENAYELIPCVKAKIPSPKINKFEDWKENVTEERVMIGFGTSRMRALEAGKLEYLKKMPEIVGIPRDEKQGG